MQTLILNAIGKLTRISKFLSFYPRQAQKRGRKSLLTTSSNLFSNQLSRPLSDASAG